MCTWSAGEEVGKIKASSDIKGGGTEAARISVRRRR